MHFLLSIVFLSFELSSTSNNDTNILRNVLEGSLTTWSPRSSDPEPTIVVTMHSDPTETPVAKTLSVRLEGVEKVVIATSADGETFEPVDPQLIVRKYASAN